MMLLPSLREAETYYLYAYLFIFYMLMCLMSVIEVTEMAWHSLRALLALGVSLAAKREQRWIKHVLLGCIACTRMRSIATDVAWSVCLFVSAVRWSQPWALPQQMNQLRFRVWTRVRLKNHVSGGSLYPPTGRRNLEWGIIWLVQIWQQMIDRPTLTIDSVVSARCCDCQIWW